MKKIVALTAISLFLSGFANAGQVLFKLKGSYFSPWDKAFQDIYGGGMIYGIEASTGILKNIEMWIEAGYFSNKGKLSFTKEETRLRIIPVGGGIRYLQYEGIKKLYACYSDIGVNYYFYRESNILGTVIWGGLGFIGKIGLFVKVKGKMIIDFFASYSVCTMKPADFRINIGGLEAGIGIGYYSLSN